MNGWMDGWMGGWVDGWMDEQTDMIKLLYSQLSNVAEYDMSVFRANDSIIVAESSSAAKTLTG